MGQEDDIVARLDRAVEDAELRDWHLCAEASSIIGTLRRLNKHQHEKIQSLLKDRSDAALEILSLQNELMNK